MSIPIKLISTDFDGTIFAEFENPPIPAVCYGLFGQLQARGTKWVINTGRDMAGLMEALGRSGIPTQPDYLVLGEREIYQHKDRRYVGLDSWNGECARAHRDLFARVRSDVPMLVEWISTRFEARLYEDDYSPFCLIADNSRDAEVIHDYLADYCRTVPDLGLVRNDVYARFHHVRFNKGTALAELARLLGLSPQEIFAAGDQLNDLPMLSRQYAHWLAAPGNAVEEVKQAVLSQGGFVSRLMHGEGVAEGLQKCLDRAQSS